MVKYTLSIYFYLFFSIMYYYDIEQGIIEFHEVLLNEKSH